MRRVELGDKTGKGLLGGVKSCSIGSGGVARIIGGEKRGYTGSAVGLDAILIDACSGWSHAGRRALRSLCVYCT
jgi:hypothetical protein